jgi:hypothetical protein
LQALLAYKLLELLAEEAARPAVATQALPALQALAPQALAAVGAALTAAGAGGEKVLVAALRCLHHWVASARIALEDAATVDDRARLHCRFVPPLVHFIPDSLTYSAPLCLRRRCGRTPRSRACSARSARRWRPTTP